jgi:transcriptional regulator MraZ
MSPLTGHRDHRIDGKDRVVIPAAQAEAIRSESQGRLYLVPSTDAPCVEAYPARVYEAMAEGQVPNRFEGDQAARRLFFGLAEPVELKGPGRITLGKRFLRYFPHGVVRVVGMNTYLELWDPEQWDAWAARATGGFPLPGSGSRGP